jgi:hypothetical protein
VTTQCEAERIIKQAIYKLDIDWGNKTIDVAGVLHILRGQGDSPCSN